jgi:hypothetical protein
MFLPPKRVETREDDRALDVVRARSRPARDARRDVSVA